MTRTIAIVNQKGGVGKTTTAVNLAASLASLGESCLLVDFDPQGNSTSGLGVQKEELEYCSYNLITGEISAEALLLGTCQTGLSLLPATIALVGAEVEIVELEDREYLLQRALAPMYGTFKYIFIDCPPSLGLLTLNALCAADSVLIPVQCEFYALEGVSQLLHTIQLIQQRFNPRLTIEGALLTMYDGRLNLNTQVAAELRRYFEDKVFHTVIPRSVRLSEAPSYGQPVLHFAPRSRGSECYLELAQEVKNNRQQK